MSIRPLARIADIAVANGALRRTFVANAGHWCIIGPQTGFGKRDLRQMGRG